jgi:hypothetical protein
MVGDRVERAKSAAETAQALAVVAGLAFGFITATLAINYGVMTYRALGALPDGASFLESVRVLAPIWVSVLPAIFFMSALWQLRRALREYAKGEFFSPRSARAVRRAGEEAFVALLAQILIAPTIISWLEGGRHLNLNFELTDLALVAFVLFVAAVGRVLDLAAVIKAENDQIV